MELLNFCKSNGTITRSVFCNTKKEIIKEKWTRVAKEKNLKLSDIIKFDHCDICGDEEIYKFEVVLKMVIKSTL